MTLRDATDADGPALAAVFRDAVDGAGPGVYTPQQVAVWRAAADDAEAFARRVLRDRTFVAADGGVVVGFATLEADGRVGFLYVRSDRQRQGVGRALLARVVAAADAAGMGPLYSEASLCSLPLFRQAGFVPTGTEVIERHGVRFERPLVRRRL